MNAKEYYDLIGKRIDKLENTINEFRKDIFGNGKPGMCTTRQELLKDWIKEEIKKVTSFPAKLVSWFYNILILGFLIYTIIKLN